MPANTTTAEQDTLQCLVGMLAKADIRHAVIGSMATELYGAHPRSNNVEVLLSPEGFGQFDRGIARAYFERVPGRPRRFSDRRNGVKIEFFLTGHHPGRCGPGPIAFPDPAMLATQQGVFWLLPLPRLIELQLAAKTHRDFAEVVSLIQTHRLDESFLNQIHPSVHRDFIECLEEKRRDDVYEARQDRMLERKLKELDQDS